MTLDGTTGIVTGASGFFGRAVLRRLPANCTVHAVYRTAEDFPHWAETCAADVRPLRLDLARERLHGRGDWALLLAARVATSTSREDPAGELQAVAGVTANTVAGLRVERLVHVSSGSVYEGLEGELGPHRVPGPRLPYAIAKLAAEHLVAAYADAPYWIIRSFGAFGPGEPRYKLARRLVERFAAGDRTFTLAGDGTNIIDPMYIDELAARLCGLLETPGESRAADLTQGERLSIRRFAELAYAAAHPSPDGGALELRFEGVAHEQMRGWASSDPALWRADLEHLSVAEGLRRYAVSVR